MRKSQIPELPELYEIINTKIRDRNQKQTSNLYEYFNSAKFGTALKSDLLLGQINLQTLFFFLSQFLEIQKFNKKDSIYYEGNRSEFIYLMVKGSITLYKLVTQIMTQDAIEYYLYLFNIYKKGEKFLLEKTIHANNDVFPVNKIADIPEIENIIFKVQLLLKAFNNDIDGIKEMLIQKNIPFEKVEFDKVIKGDYSLEEYYQDQASLMKEAELFYYKIIENTSKKETKILEFSAVRDVQEKEFFGDYKLGDFENKRSETAIVKEPTIVIAINKRLYSTCILNDKRNIREKEIETLHQNSFFKLMRKHIFAKNFFYECDLVETCKNTMIYNEGDQIDYIYIIKEGTFELSINNKSVFDLKSTITHLKKLNDEFASKEFDDVLGLRNSPNVLAPLMRVRKNYSLFVTEKDVFGLWEYVYGSDMIYNIQVLSDKAKLYKISIAKLEKPDNEDMNLLQRGIKSEAEKKIKNVLERLIMLKNSVMMKIDFEFTKKTKDDEDNFYRNNSPINTLKNSVNNKVQINFPKKNHNITTKSYKNVIYGFRHLTLNKSMNLNQHNIYKAHIKKLSDLAMSEPNLQMPIRNHRKEKSITSTIRPISDESRSIKTRKNSNSNSSIIKETEMLAKIQKLQTNNNTYERGMILVNNSNEITDFDNIEQNEKKVVFPKLMPKKNLRKITKRKISKNKDKDNEVKNLYLNEFLDDEDLENIKNNNKNINYLAVRKFYSELKPYSNYK